MAYVCTYNVFTYISYMLCFMRIAKLTRIKQSIIKQFGLQKLYHCGHNK